MDRNELMNEICRFLLQNPDTQIGSIRAHLGQTCSDRYFIQMESFIHDYLHLLSINNIIRRGKNILNHSNAFIMVTEYGRECLEKQFFLPVDPDGYLTRIRQEIPELDDISYQYLSESINAYHRNCLLSATITLGVASEQLILILIESFSNWLTDANMKQKLVKTETYSLFKRYIVFKELLKTVDLPAELKINSDVYLDTIFNFIRINRNEAGHPTGSTMVKSIVYSNLQIFLQYAKRIMNLIKFFNQGATT